MASQASASDVAQYDAIIIGADISGVLVGPHNAASFCNIPRCIEQNVEWVRDLVSYMGEQGYTRIEPRSEAVEEWTQHVHDGVEKLLFSKVNSWFMGINPNIPGCQKRHFLLYAGGLPLYRKR